jgi:hypothetical protein
MKVNLIQGIYFLVTGLWPVFNIKSFEKVSGEKTDKWLVKTLGLLIIAVAVVLIFSTESTKMLGISSAAALAIADFYYSVTNRISKVYLIDGLIEVVIIGLWLAIS